jgi:hypothetical protein
VSRALGHWQVRYCICENHPAGKIPRVKTMRLIAVLERPGIWPTEKLPFFPSWEVTVEEAPKAINQ